MVTRHRHRIVLCALAVVLAGCAGKAPRVSVPDGTVHADLLTAGLGIDGLRQPTPPVFADSAAPTAEELRRRALWTAWRGIADLAPGGGYGDVYGSVAPVPGREYVALLRLPDAHAPHRVVVQVPDGFDRDARCVVVAAASGSRGAYGAIALAGAWGLPRGCAVVHTDKGGGSDYAVLGNGRAAGVDGRYGAADDASAFVAAADAAAPPYVAAKHLHSGDNPEAAWGAHMRQAAAFGLRVLDAALPDAAPFTRANTRIVATGLSNGGGAVLRAIEGDAALFDAAVALAPNVWAGEGGRALYDYATEAALYLPCALLAPPFAALRGPQAAAWQARCEGLRAAQRLHGADTAALADAALAHLHAQGWTDAAVADAAVSTQFDLWRAIAAGYAAAYARSGADAMPCGYAYAFVDANGAPRMPSDGEQAALWSDASGIPPGNGVMLLDQLAGGADPVLPGLLCLRALWEGDDPTARTVRASIDATRAALPRRDLPLIVVHGSDDGLVVPAFSSEPYVQWLRANDRDARHWRVAHAQHFDAFLGMPVFAARHLPLLPYGYRALDAVWAHIEDGAPLPDSADIQGTPRGAGPLQAGMLALP